jgi:Zn-dependent peptidase ImmA (M78 family)
VIEKFPETIRIGPKDYKLRDQTEVEDVESRGLVDHHKTEMALKPGLGSQQANLSLMHEIIHAIFETSGLSKLNDDEQLVDVLAAYLVMLIRDNPVEEMFR